MTSFPRGGSRRHGLGPGLAALAVAALAAAVGTLVWGAPAPAADNPPLPPDAAAAPLGRPLDPPPGVGGYAAMETQQGSGEPVRWDPCRPVHVVVNSQAAPPPAEYLLTSAVTEIERVTGQRIVLEGATDEAPSATRNVTRAAAQRDRYGDRWAPVLVAWSDPGLSPGLAGSVAGYAGPLAVEGSLPGQRRYVTGEVVLDGPQIGELAAGPAGLARARGVLLHELGHLMGLDHVDDPNQLLYPSTTLLGVELADGDLRGLAAVSGGPCFRDW